jgi:pimeloyl-ACP methyl ester carboxylesterase
MGTVERLLNMRVQMQINLTKRMWELWNITNASTDRPSKNDSRKFSDTRPRIASNKGTGKLNCRFRSNGPLSELTAARRGARTPTSFVPHRELCATSEGNTSGVRRGWQWREFGSASGEPPVVAIPGFGVARYLVAGCDQLARLSGRRVLLVEPPGFGANTSQLSGPRTITAVAEGFTSWLADVGPMYLLGQSTGCVIAARIAAMGGPDVIELALAGPVFDPGWATAARAARRLLRDGLREPWWLGPTELPEWLRNAGSLPTFLRSCLPERLDERLSTVHCPVVVVRGEQDPLSRHEWAMQLANGSHRTLVTVPGGSHTFMAARPHTLAESLSLGRFAQPWTGGPT